ncbi:MAG: hypothetical protein ACFFCI_02145 [Promethearchaeota archaeon]
MKKDCVKCKFSTWELEYPEKFNDRSLRLCCNLDDEWVETTHICNRFKVDWRWERIELT